MRNDKRSLFLSLPLPLSLSLSLFPVSLFHLTHSRVCSQSLHSLFSNSFGNIFLSQSSFFLSLSLYFVFISTSFFLSLSLSLSFSLSLLLSLLLSLYFSLSTSLSLYFILYLTQPVTNTRRTVLNASGVCVCVWKMLRKS